MVGTWGNVTVSRLLSSAADRSAEQIPPPSGRFAAFVKTRWLICQADRFKNMQSCSIMTWVLSCLSGMQACVYSREVRIWFLSMLVDVMLSKQGSRGESAPKQSMAFYCIANSLAKHGRFIGTFRAQRQFNMLYTRKLHKALKRHF